MNKNLFCKLAIYGLNNQDLCKDFRSETNETDIEVLDIDALNSNMKKKIIHDGGVRILHFQYPILGK